MAKFLMLAAIYIAFWLADLARLRKLGSREWTAYIAILLVSIYLGIDYVGNLPWPFLEDAALDIFGKPAKFIFESLKAPS